VILLWSLLMYVGQALKDTLCLPRPASPRVARLEVHYAAEYGERAGAAARGAEAVSGLRLHAGMPSTHAMVAASMPWYLAFIVRDRIDASGAVCASVASGGMGCVRGGAAAVPTGWCCARSQVLLAICIVWFVCTCMSRLCVRTPPARTNEHTNTRARAHAHTHARHAPRTHACAQLHGRALPR
jgi:membrane-associated phospholipid phosphatase